MTTVFTTLLTLKGESFCILSTPHLFITLSTFSPLTPIPHRVGGIGASTFESIKPLLALFNTA